MTAWRWKIEGVTDLLERFPDEESRVNVIAKQVAGTVRESVREAKATRRLTPRDTIGLDGLLNELGDTDDEATFNDLLARLYDWADDFGVWIAMPS